MADGTGREALASSGASMPRRGRVSAHKKGKNFLAFLPSLPRMPLVCGSLLAMLALATLITVPLLDLDNHLSPLVVSKKSVPVHSSKNLLHPTGILIAARTSDTMWASKFAPYFHGCSSPRTSFLREANGFQSNGYLLIQTSGGLNQQRTGIIDAVVVARILNATLVIPQLDHKSFWKDSSNFSDIFDIDWFINSLANDVVIVKELPAKFHGKFYRTRVPRRCKPEYFRTKILPTLRKKKALRLGKFDYRLSNRLESELQKLRCRVNYHALRFTKDVETMGQVLVERLRQKSNRYIALHLRFESDMLAFSGCYYGGGDKEIRELGLLRKRWKTLHHWNPEKERRNGKCPLTPEEVGIMLRALGFGRDCHLYVASGEVYGGEDTLAPLKQMFPNYHTKDTLALEGELERFAPFSSRMAAIDFIVSDESNVFIANNNGNMARILAGRRRYFDHKRTIRPNTKKLGSLFLAKPNMTWEAFTLKLQRVQRGFMGDPNEMKPGRGQFFENPSACICENAETKVQLKFLQQQEEELLHIQDLQEDEMLKSQAQLIGVSELEDNDEQDADADPDLEDITLMQQEDMLEEDNLLERSEGIEADNLSLLSD